MKKLLATASVLALLAPAAVLAQDQSTTPSATPDTEMQAPPRTPEVTPPLSAAPDTSTEARSAEATPVLSGQWRASKLMGVDIKNSAGESIGNVNDLLLDTDGRITAVVVGVGGFLGIGEKNVALAFDELSISRNANEAVVAKANATRESLKAAPEWKDPTVKS